MSYKIVVDSCCDLTQDMKKWDNLQVVPLTLEIGDYRIFDDENFDQDDFIRRTRESSVVGKSACPSPEAFKQAYEGDYDDIYVLTITSKLSGTYNSALQGKALYEEEYGDTKNIHVLDSRATSGLETIVAQKIKNLADSGAEFKQVVDTVEDYIVNHTELYFCLESLDVLKNNGRLFALAATLLEKIRVKLVCKRTEEGNISLAGQDLTINRALTKMANFMAEKLDGKDVSRETLVIAHVCCEDRAKLVADKISAKMNFGNVTILKASGLNSLYAADGGIIVSFSY